MELNMPAKYANFRLHFLDLIRVHWCHSRAKIPRNCSAQCKMRCANDRVLGYSSGRSSNVPENSHGIRHFTTGFDFTAGRDFAFNSEIAAENDTALNNDLTAENSDAVERNRSLPVHDQAVSRDD